MIKSANINKTFFSAACAVITVFSLGSVAMAVESGYIVSVSPSTFVGGVPTTVTVRVYNSGESDDMIIQWNSKPTGWSITPSYLNPYMAVGTYYNALFTVTAPVAGGSGTIVWGFYDDDVLSNDLLDTENQSVSATASKPDLIAYSCTVTDTTVDPGQSITVNWTAKNQGTYSAGSTQQGVMWSTDSSISRSDTLLDREYLGSMGVNVTSPESHVITIPANATPGQTYYIGAYEDYDLTENESSESNNNSNAVAVTVNAPDLIAYSCTVSDTTVDPGQSITVNWTAKNQGNGSAGSTQQGVMWSTDSSISRSDTLLDREYLGPMGVNVTSPESHTITIPANATPGQTYYIGAYADYDLAVNEGSYENNNNSNAVAVTVNYPDLIAYSCTVTDTTVDPGQSITVNWTAKNQGNGSCGATQQGVMWSTDSSISWSDTLLDKEYLGSMGVNVTSPESHTITIPANAIPGQTYYIGAYEDYDLSVNEGSYENNNNSNAVTVTVNAPDLIAYSCTVTDTTVDPGQSITVNWTAKNQGNGSAGATQQGVMWSTDSTISRSDTLLEREYLGSMGVGVTSPESHTITIPTNATPGQTYYIGAYADYDLGVNEGSNENNNNSNAVAVTVNALPADLAVTSVDAVESGTYQPGDQIQVNYVIQNIGGQNSGSFTVDFYASINTTITTSDYKIGSATYSDLQAGWTFSGADICRFPPNSFDSSPIPSGDYYTGIIVTCSNDSNPANNTGYDSDPVTVTVPPADIRIEPLTLNFEASATSGGGGKAASSGESFDESKTSDVEQDMQSKTGPVPPESVLERDREEMKRLKSLTLEEKEQLSATQYTISGVPEYIWRHGCGPTSVGMVIGYYDVHGYGDLISGDASTQTNAVNQAIASGGDSTNPNPPGSERHYEDYSRPEDYTTPNMITDDYITKGRPAHADDCIGDYMDTSKSTRNSRYGSSWSSDIGPSYIGYVNQQDSSYNPSYTQYTWSGGTLTWDVLKNEIDSSRPMVFLVDTDGDGNTDHFVPVIGYDDGSPHMYACYTTWASMPGVRWYDFQGVGNNWGVWGGWSLELAPSKSFTVYNDGSRTLNVTNITEVNNSSWLSFSPEPPFDIAAGSSQIVTVSVDPTGLSPDTYSDRLLVYSNDTDESPYPGGVYVNLTVTCTPPEITNQPDSQTVCVGQDAVFNVVATGTEPLHYQWKKNGANVGIDSSTLTLYGVQLSDDGSEIWCEVTNGCGSDTSLSTFLTVYPWPTVTINPNPDQLNAAWILDGPNGYTYSSTGDETIAGLEFGSYTITWSAIPSWNTPLPNPDTKNLSIGNSINFIGNYQLIADYNNDYSVDFEDLAILVNYWLVSDSSIDLTGDDFIDFSDFAVLAENWLEGI